MFSNRTDFYIKINSRIAFAKATNEKASSVSRTSLNRRGPLWDCTKECPGSRRFSGKRKPGTPGGNLFFLFSPSSTSLSLSLSLSLFLSLSLSIASTVRETLARSAHSCFLAHKGRLSLIVNREPRAEPFLLPTPTTVLLGIAPICLSVAHVPL